MRVILSKEVLSEMHHGGEARTTEGATAEQNARDNLRTTHQAFLREKHPSKRDEAGKDLIRAIFGKNAIAEDPFL